MPADKRLAEINRQIAERAKYLRSQETLIATTIESGNMKLMELNHDITVTTQQLKNLKVDIRNAREDKRLLEEDLEMLRSEARTLDAAAFAT